MKIDQKFNTLSVSQYLHYIKNYKKYIDFNTLGLYRSLMENEALNLKDKIKIRDYAHEFFFKAFEFLQIKDPYTYFEVESLGEELTASYIFKTRNKIKEYQEKTLKEKRIKHKNFGITSKHECGRKYCPYDGLMLKANARIGKGCIWYDHDNDISYKESKQAKKTKQSRKNSRNIIENIWNNHNF